MMLYGFISLWTTDVPTNRIDSFLCIRIGMFLTFNYLFYSEPAAKVMVELLGSYTEDNASQARVDAHR